MTKETLKKTFKGMLKTPKGSISESLPQHTTSHPQRQSHWLQRLTKPRYMPHEQWNMVFHGCCIFVLKIAVCAHLRPLANLPW